MGSHQASFGKALAKNVEGHGQGFLEAFQDALERLDDDEFGGDKLEVRLFVSIEPNPGGVSQYTVTLNPGGVSQY
jgi:hypothetical protein